MSQKTLNESLEDLHIAVHGLIEEICKVINPKILVAFMIIDFTLLMIALILVITK